jgi:hypothetical protein
VLLACLPLLGAVGVALSKLSGRIESSSADAYAQAQDLAQQAMSQVRLGWVRAREWLQSHYQGHICPLAAAEVSEQCNFCLALMLCCRQCIQHQLI